MNIKIKTPSISFDTVIRMRDSVNSGNLFRKYQWTDLGNATEREFRNLVNLGLLEKISNTEFREYLIAEKHKLREKLLAQSTKQREQAEAKLKEQIQKLDLTNLSAEVVSQLLTQVSTLNLLICEYDSSTRHLQQLDREIQNIQEGIMDYHNDMWRVSALGQELLAGGQVTVKL